MKKINIILAFILLFVCNACDMNKMPEGQLSAEEPMTMQDCRNYRIGFYTSFRTITTGAAVLYSEVQLDDFHAISGTTGSLNILYNGSITPGLELVNDIWATDYAVIAQVNYYLSKVDELKATGLTQVEELELNRYVGEALFTRAFSYFDLAQRFCDAYTAENIGKEYGGLPLVTKYNPTDNNSEYPGRSSMEATYKLILDDLDKAMGYVLAYEAKDSETYPLQYMSSWINSDVIKALQARVALMMNDYSTAFKKSEELINSNRYPLMSDEAYFASLWSNDNGTEAIWRVTMSINYLGNATGSIFLTNSGNMSFIPTANTLKLYGSGDIRPKAYFATKAVRVTGSNSVSVQAFYKYPGNYNLYSNTGVNNFVNMSKPFRIAEQYLIAAEAAARLGNNLKANQHLESIQRSRIKNHISKSLVGDALINAIKLERHRELIGEGFRLADLKRWGDGFERSIGQNSSVINQVGNVHRLSYPAKDYRLVWPIPQEEIDVNPQIKSQQNPGY